MPRNRAHVRSHRHAIDFESIQLIIGVGSYDMRLSFIRFDGTRARCSVLGLTSVLALATLVGCGGADGHAPAAADDGERAPAAKAGPVADDHGSTNGVSITETSSAGPRGLLDLTAVGALDQSLGTLEFQVRNRAGKLLSKGFNNVQGADTERHLLLELPAGEDYDVSLDSVSEGGPKCHAGIASLSIPEGGTASYQAFLWQCEEAPEAKHECYWLADWVGASRTRAAVGESIELGISASEETGAPAQVSWLEPRAKHGSFSHRHGAHTAFTCESAAADISLEVVIAGHDCSRRLSLTVSCF